MRRIKRLVDILVACILLVLLAPVLLVVAALVRINMGRPILFKQTRIGYRGRPFSILKFRTMLAQKDARGQELPDAQRLTRFGRWLRASSLDELPELLNIVRGQMSLVGPRPLLPEYLPLYSPRQALRHAVPPGLTGWAQVNGRNALDWDARLELDAWYVENWSLGLDTRILLSTLLTVLRSEGISAPGHVSMERFIGPRASTENPPRQNE